MQPLQCGAGVMEPALGAAAGLGRWFVGGAFLPVCGDFQRRTKQSPTTVPRGLSVREWPALGLPGALQGQMQLLQCAVDLVEPALEGAVGLSRWFVGGAVLPLLGEVFRGGGSTRQPQRIEPCHCVSGQPWAYYGALQG